MKLIGSNGKYFYAVMTPNRENLKEEEDKFIVKETFLTPNKNTRHHK